MAGTGSEQRGMQMLKLIILGDTGVGKTSLVARLTHKAALSSPPTPTVGLDFTTCQIQVDNSKVLVNIWDTAGQERFHSLLPAYCRQAHGAIIMFDLTDLRSFHALNTCMHWADDTLPEDTCKLLVGNKRDLAERGQREVTSWTAKEWADEEGAEYVELSMTESSTDDLIAVFFTLLRQMVQKFPPPLPFHSSKSRESDGKSKCCF